MKQLLCCLKINVCILMTLVYSFNITSSRLSENGINQSNGTEENTSIKPNITGGLNEASLTLISSKCGFCSGVLIMPEWILCPAHCLVGDTDKAKDNEVEIFGSLTILEDLKHTPSKSLEVHIHEKYDPNTAFNDIAIIKINPGESGKVKPIEAGFLSIPWSDDLNCYAAEIEKTINKQMRVQYFRKSYSIVPRHGLEACPCIREKELLSKIICTDGKHGCDYSPSSMGGSIMCNRSLLAIPRQVVDCRKCNPDEPVSDCGQRFMYRTYTFICPYFNWLQEKIKSEKLQKVIESKFECSAISHCETCLENSSTIVNTFTRNVLLVKLLSIILINIIYI